MRSDGIGNYSRLFLASLVVTGTTSSMTMTTINCHLPKVVSFVSPLLSKARQQQQQQYKRNSYLKHRWVCLTSKDDASENNADTGSNLGNANQFTGVRFSLYPNVAKEVNPSLREAVKYAVKDLYSLGLEVRPDDVSSCLLGPEPALFDALRIAFGRASRTIPSSNGDDDDDDDGDPRNVSMQCTFSAGCPGEDGKVTLISPTEISEQLKKESRSCLPPRIACQFAIYPLGITNHMDDIYKVIEHAKTFSCWKDGEKTHFCSMLDGDGNEVFDVLRSSFALARETSSANHVVMTATLTANKNMWPESDRR